MPEKPTYKEIEARVRTLEDNLTECNQGNGALREAELQLQQLLSRLPVGIYRNTPDRSGRFILANETIAKMFGYESSEDIMKIDMSDLYADPSERDTFSNTLLCKSAVSDVELRLKKKDGSVLWGSVTAKVIRNKQGDIEYFEGIVEDITERKHAEIARKKERDFISNVLYWIDSLVAVIDVGGFIVSFNRASEQLSGYRFQEVRDTPFWNILLDPDEREGVKATIKDVAHKGLPKDFQNYWVTKAGKKRLIRWHNSVLRKPDGSIEYILSAGIDITERHKSEKALRKSEAKYRELVQNANSIIVRFDTDGRITFFNEYAQKFFGYSGEGIIGKDVVGTILPETDTAGRNLSSLLSKIVRNPEQYINYENENMLRNGQRVWVTWANKAIYSPDGELTEILCIGNDITKRKRNEEALKQREAVLQSIFKVAPIGIGLVNDRIIIQANNRLCEMIGITQEELLNQNAKIVYPTAEDYKYVGREKYKQITEKGTGTVETRWQHKNGEILDILMSSTPINISDWSEGVTFTALDITDRKKSEEKLTAAHKMFLTVLDGIDATIYVADMETHEVLFMNKNMIDSFGRDMTGEICWDVLRGESGPCSHCSNNKLVDENGSPKDVHIWQDQNPITQKWYINHDRAIEWIDGRLVRIQIATDITKLKSMEEELRQSQKFESIGTLTGGIAHDFNNILSIIVGNTELALDKVSEWNPAHSNLEEIKTASLRATKIVKQLLSFSRKTDQELQPNQITLVIKDTLKFLRSTIPTTIDILQNIQTTDETILADPTQINQIMMNLFINASQAMEQTGGNLTVTVEKAILDENSAKNYPDLSMGNYVKVMVSDTGPGIAPEIIDRIFDPYFTTKEVDEGSGMGLAIVHVIVKNHRGAITVDSKPGRGTTFSILFPITTEKPEIEKDTTDELLLGNETVLFVDDEKSIVEVVQMMLELLGYNVKTAMAPQNALDQFSANPRQFDLVITDMTMPKMTGVMLSEKIMEIRPDIPVIICTGHSALIDEERAKQLGIGAYVMKPIDMEEIAKTIRKVLDESKSAAQG